MEQYLARLERRFAQLIELFERLAGSVFGEQFRQAEASLVVGGIRFDDLTVMTRRRVDVARAQGQFCLLYTSPSPRD